MIRFLVSYVGFPFSFRNWRYSVIARKDLKTFLSQAIIIPILPKAHALTISPSLCFLVPVLSISIARKHLALLFIPLSFL